ncbi:hypothetical protein TRFO_40570 [Tritrichomonas foetus]|uniref:Protein kinase domain-containing protein n=1 Tax=Tritrichomonas foetus TaxID=1144522 RepID=A0A1J4J4Q1_9EUKA|nr:hypothetical protein TRFO_40570 [Tritrichomonas foetus]|eukprot:OHS93119.1 hypothetical protein TRFO_40570 [Tritrichomonas foetus]
MLDKDANYITSFKNIQKDPIVMNLHFNKGNILRTNSEMFGGKSVTKANFSEIGNPDTSFDFPCMCKGHGSSPSDLEKNYREIYFLCHLKNLHPCIVEIYGWCDTYFLMEYVANDSLRKIRKDRKIKLTGTQKTKIMLGIAHVLNFLHQNEIVHCDVSSNNILLDDNFEPKLIDFETTKFLDFPRDQIGTLHFIPPELLKSYPNSIKSDIFSFGAVIWQLETEEEIPITMYDINSNFERMILNTDTMNPGLKFLIDSSREEHPDMRFDLSVYIKLIISGKSVFDGTDMNEVREYYNRLEANTIHDFERNSIIK